QEEFSALQSEVDRVAQTTKFNGVELLNSAAGQESHAADFHVGWETGANNKVSMSILNMGTSALSGNGATVGSLALISGTATVTAASAAVQALDETISKVTLQRASWGAVQNRLESTTSNLANVNENIQSARSGMEDADFAKESANLAKAQVLQQAGMSMLSQANQQSQNVLSLLR
ncbi:MAG: flagellin, partial [Hydrogenovibrio sp.]|uniref:flagellin n=1 Tax=Hydrogenovibrio sp. TaxID=2065821 RepID=UPI00286FDA32